MKGRTAGLCRGAGSCACVFVFACLCENHRICGVSAGRSRLRHGACAQRPTLKAGLCLIEGICFSVGLYMVAPRLAEGPCAMWQISAEDGDASGRARRGREREREIRYGGGILGSGTPRSISNQDNCRVPGAGFSLPCFCSADSYSNSGSERVAFLLIVPQFSKF